MIVGIWRGWTTTENADADESIVSTRVLIRFFAEGGGQDVSRVEEGARLLWEWTREGMAVHGWFWEETPSGQN